MNRIYRWITLWAPATNTILFATFAIYSQPDTRQNILGTIAVASAAMGIAMQILDIRNTTVAGRQLVSHHADKDNQ